MNGLFKLFIEQLGTLFQPMLKQIVEKLLKNLIDQLSKNLPTGTQMSTFVDIDKVVNDTLKDLS